MRVGAFNLQLSLHNNLNDIQQPVELCASVSFQCLFLCSACIPLLLYILVPVSWLEDTWIVLTCAFSFVLI